MLSEEYAFILGDATSTAAPWGDGSNALAFNGLVNLITTANGTPSGQVLTSVGPLTLSHIDSQLYSLFKQGAKGIWILMNGVEVQSLTHLLIASGSPARYIMTPEGKGVLGGYVSNYVDAITGEMVPIVPSRFLPAGTILFMSSYLPDGTVTADVDVLPQVQLPALAPNEGIQGYVAQDLAPTTAAPQVYPFLVSCFEVLRLKSALKWGAPGGNARMKTA